MLDIDDLLFIVPQPFTHSFAALILEAVEHLQLLSVTHFELYPTRTWNPAMTNINFRIKLQITKCATSH